MLLRGLGPLGLPRGRALAAPNARRHHPGTSRRTRAGTGDWAPSTGGLST